MASGLLGAITGASNGLGDALTGGQQSPASFQQNGFIVPPIPSADGTGLPSSKIPSLQLAVATRNIMSIYVPEIGLVQLFIAPQSISYNEKKLITQTRTKGGYSLQYFGEQLTTLNVSGHTGSSGVDGLNVLDEVYRSEQLMFDPIALTLAANNSITGLNGLIDSSLGSLGGLGSSISNATFGLLGLDPASSQILPQNPPSLASMCFGIEIYWNSLVYRGYFDNFTFKESVDRMGLFDYDFVFVSTERRGYRTNSFAFQKSAISGPSGNNVPYSFSTLQSNQIPRVAGNPSVGTPFSQ